MAWIAPLVLCLPACVSRPTLSETDKAKLITEKRLEARDCLEKFRASGEEDLEVLERYVALHRETTDIAPATCPRCWAAYGEALSMLGWYYYEIYADALEDANRDPRKAQRYKQEAQEYRLKWEDYFQQSNQAYENHLRSRQVQYVHPYTYERIMRHYEIFENYERALYFLQRSIDAYPTLEEPDRQKWEKLRRLYKQELQRQKEKGLAPDDGPSRRQPGSRRAAARSRHQGDEEEEE